MVNPYIALLRGINVSGQKKIKMADLRKFLSDSGLRNVSTYIQTGNIFFQHKEVDTEVLTMHIKSVIFDNYGFDVNTLVLTGEDLTWIWEHNPYADRYEEGGMQRVYVTVLGQAPDPAKIEEIQSLETKNEEFHITSRAIYLWVPDGYGKTKLDNNFFERKLRVPGTTRNWKTMGKLMEMMHG